MQQKIAIIGLGLLGTSLGYALRNTSFLRMGWTRNPVNLARALEDGVLDQTYLDVETVIAQADIIVLCMPIDDIVRDGLKWIPLMKKGAILTDVGSVKGYISSALQPVCSQNGVYFIGSHPMTGTEHSGYEAAVKNLYQNAPVFITPTSDIPREKVNILRLFWEACHTRVIEISIEKHDEIVAHTSHISHLLALTLTLTVLDLGDTGEQPLYDIGCAGGFRDTTRIASSNPKMWRNVIERNADEVIDAMNHFKSHLDEISQMIQKGDFDAFENAFEKGKQLRDKWLQNRYQEN